MHAASLLLLGVFWDAHLVRWVVWVGLVVLTVSLLLLIRTRWGQSQPLSKCVVLSLLAHLLLGIYMTTVNIVTAQPEPTGKGLQLALVDGGEPDGTPDAPAADRWNAVPDAESSLDNPADLVTSLPPLPAVDNLPPAPADHVPTFAPAKLPALPHEDAPAPTFSSAGPRLQPSTKSPQPAEMPQEDVDTGDLVPPPAPEASPNSKPDKGPDRGADNGGRGAPAGSANGSGELQGAAAPAAPAKALQQRLGNHLGGGAGTGATKETEAAVIAALKYLVSAQEGNGRWDPRRQSGGAARASDGQDRQAAGAHADTGITGLALLAFLASGHTHLQGPHRDTVRRGLEFLLISQDSNGCLGATNNTYERMYCHAMATCALSEAYAMTKDSRLLPALRAAIGYTVRTQDRTSGSWRYLVGQTGDTSQLGWQLMSLKSAELGGIPIPSDTRNGIERFLRSVASGRGGGLACYQPARPIATRSMTAEALACRQFLGRPDSPDTIREACDFVLQEPPGSGATNHYYWYYATLGLHQVQGEAWTRWNEALKRNLLATQRSDGTLAGSWDPDPVWGGCGGRVYSTSLCTLCLEVYYRFLPLYSTAGTTRLVR